MKLSNLRVNFRVSPAEHESLERVYQEWLARERTKEDGRYARARIWTRSAFARELFRDKLRELVALSSAGARS